MARPILRTGAAGVIVLGASLAVLLSAPSARASTQDAELIYECALALDYAADLVEPDSEWLEDLRKQLRAQLNRR